MSAAEMCALCEAPARWLIQTEHHGEMPACGRHANAVMDGHGGPFTVESAYSTEVSR